MSGRPRYSVIALVLIGLGGCGRSALDDVPATGDVAGAGGGAGTGGGSGGAGTGGGAGGAGAGGAAGGSGGMGQGGGSGGSAGVAGNNGLDGGPGGSGGGVVMAPRLVILPDNATLPLNRNTQFSAYLQQNGRSQDVTAQTGWKLDNAAVGTLGVNGPMAGLFRGLKAGSANIVAGYQALTATTMVKVTDATVTAVIVTPQTLSVDAGKSLPVKAQARYSDGTSADVTEQGTWSSANMRVASVSNDPGQRGTVTGQTGGQTTVTFAFAGAQSLVVVQVQGAMPANHLTVGPENQTKNVGESQAFTATLTVGPLMQNVTGQAQWNSSDNRVATVNRGTAQCVAAGTATISASVMGTMALTTLICSEGKLKGIAITPSETSVPQGTKVNFLATAYFLDGTSRNITEQAMWATSDVAVAQVSNTPAQRGLVTTIGAGNITITATYSGNMATAKLAVTPKP